MPPRYIKFAESLLTLLSLARILAETIYAMLKNNVRYIERERMETVNPDELYFKRLGELS